MEIKNDITKKIFKKAIFIFRRDLRVFDNIGLIQTLKSAEKVYPIFIFDPRQIDPSKNDYYSNRAARFMCNSLISLDQQINKLNPNSNLNILHGDYSSVVRSIIKETRADLLCVNMDYTPFSTKRDKETKEICEEHDIIFKDFEDICLLTKKQVEFENGIFPKIFSKFKKKILNAEILKPDNSTFNNFSEKPIDSKYLVDIKNVHEFYSEDLEENSILELKGGREEGLKLMENIPELKNYDWVRRSPSQKTSRLSPHNKFGTVSIREVYWKAKDTLEENSDHFIRQLFCRDFYYYLGYYYPKIFEGPLHPKYEFLEWNENEDEYSSWKLGKTGIPIVDASMRKLNKTGNLSNRCRFIVSNFLVKQLNIDWRKGEKYFAKKLIDYDPCLNNGGWQWCAGCNSDYNPDFRIFDINKQSSTYDPEAEFIKKWVPELEMVSKDDIHQWEENHTKYPQINYPAPLRIYSESKMNTIEIYKKAFEKFEQKLIN